MAEEVYRIEIPVEVVDRSGSGIQQAQQRVAGFERVVERTRKSLQRFSRDPWRTTITALDKASPVIRKVWDSASRLVGRTWSFSVRAVDMATGPLRAIGRLATSVGGLVAGGAALYGGVVAPLKMADDLTRASRGFETFLGSAEKARRFMAQIQRFGADTPFEADWLTEQSTMLLPALGKDPEKVMRTLKAFGDAASLTGAGTHGMEMSLLGFRQIGAIGVLNMEELRQVTENLRVPMSVIVEELGVSQKALRDIGSKGIPAAKAMDAILRALERPVAKGGFLGGMSAMMDTMSGQFSMLKDNVKQSWIQRWGKGLESGVIPFLKELNGLFANGADQVKSWGDVLERTGRQVSEWVTGKVRQVSDAVRDMINSPEWAKADTLWEKAQVAWDKLIQKPFDQWWNDDGKDWVEKKAKVVGHAFGGALGGFVSNVLGIASGKTDNSFMDAGATAGKAFLSAFLEAFDAKKITAKLGEAFLNIQGSTAGTLLDIYLLKQGIDLIRWGRGLFPKTGGGGPSLPVPGGGCCCPCGGPGTGMPGTPMTKTPPILGPDGKPLPPSTPPKPTTPPASPWKVAAKETMQFAGKAALSLWAAEMITDHIVWPAIGEGVVKGLDAQQDRHLKELATKLADPNPTPKEKAMREQIRNTEASFQAAPPKLKWWEHIFTTPYLQAKREEEWDRSQQKAREAAQAARVPVHSTNSGGTVTVEKVELHLAPQIHAATSAQEVMDIIRTNIGPLSDELQEQVARALEGSLRNRVANRSRFEPAIALE